MYSFLGCEKAKILTQKGCEKAKTLFQHRCVKTKTLPQNGRVKANTLSQNECVMEKNCLKMGDQRYKLWPCVMVH